MSPELEHWEARFASWCIDQPTDAAHDLEHLRRVAAVARRLAADEGAALEVVIPAAWLHDCVYVAKDSPDRARASRLSAEHAVQLLVDWGYPSSRHDDIAHAIEAHSFTAAIPARTIEARVVRDADRLDAIGAVGLARCLGLGGAMGRELYSIDDPFCRQRAPDDRRFTVDHFYAKLLTLESTMQTASGRAEAARRTDFLRQFLDQLRGELTGLQDFQG
jgi:uncharacterized protein